MTTKEKHSEEIQQLLKQDPKDWEKIFSLQEKRDNAKPETESEKESDYERKAHSHFINKHL